MKNQEIRLSRVIGVDGSGIHWSQLLVFFLAYFATSVLYIVVNLFQSGPPPLWMILASIFAPVIFAAACLIGFRLLPGDWPAIAVASVSYMLLNWLNWALMVPGYVIRLDISFIFRFLWIFLVLAGIKLALRHIEKLWLALFAGKAAAFLVDTLLVTIVNILVRENYRFTLGSGLWDISQGLVSAMVFAGVFVAGMSLMKTRDFVFSGRSVGIPQSGRPSAVTQYGQLKKAFDLLRIKKHLRAAGIGSIIFGLIAVGLGMATIEQSPLNAVLAIIGIGLLVEGIWVLAAPSAIGFVIDGIALIVLGIWNTLITLSARATGGRGPAGFLFLGIMQIIWGIQSMRTYGELAYLKGEKPGGAESRELDSLVDSLKVDTAAGSSDVIRLRPKSSSQKVSVRGKLLDEGALFIGPKGEIYAPAKDDVSITPDSAETAGEETAVLLTLMKASFRGYMTRTDMDRLLSWKHA